MAFRSDPMLLVLLTNSRDLQRVELINDIESPNLEWKDAAADLKKWGEKMIASLVSKRERLNQLGFQIFGRNWLLLFNKPGLSRTNTELNWAMEVLRLVFAKPRVNDECDNETIFSEIRAGTNAALGLAWAARFSHCWSRGKTHVSRLVELSARSGLIACSMIIIAFVTQFIRTSSTISKRMAANGWKATSFAAVAASPSAIFSPRKVWAVRITLLLLSSDLKAWPTTKTTAGN